MANEAAIVIEAIRMAARRSRPFPVALHFLLCPVEIYPSLTPYKRRLQARHADGWGLGGPHTDDGDQIPQVPGIGS